MNTITDIRQYQWVIKWQQRSFIKYFSRFNNDTDAFRNFTTDIFTMCMPDGWLRKTMSTGHLFHDPRSYVSFHNHPWIQIEVIIWKNQNRSKVIDFLACVTLKYDEWPWKTTGHLFYAKKKILSWRKLWHPQKIIILIDSDRLILCQNVEINSN